MSQPVLPDELRAQLASGKYTRWAGDFSAQHLQAVLWMVGEFTARALSILEVLDKHRGDLRGAMRGVFALQMLSQMINYGERFDVNGFVHRMNRGRAWLEHGDLPDALQSALERAAPGVEWTQVTAKDADYTLWGKDESGRSIGARIDAKANMAITRQLTAAEVPQAVRDALSRLVPQGEVNYVRSRGPDAHAVDAYEATVSDAQHNYFTVVVRPDGAMEQ